jgi:hypothetical protein
MAERLFRCVWYIIPHFPERSRFKSIASMSEKIRDHDRQDPTAKLGPLWGESVDFCNNSSVWRSSAGMIVNVVLTDGVNTWLTVILKLTMEKDRARGGSYANSQARISLFLLRENANRGEDAGLGTRRVHLR